ncbi:MAG: phosphatidate cytidylyltransferase [Chitinophagaceae bacterium]
MAFNWQTFRTRTLTAIIFAAVMLLGLLWNHWSFFILFSVIHFGCWWEYLKLTEKICKTTFHPYTKLGFMVTGYGLLLWFCSPAYNINSYSLKANISLPVSAAGFALLVTGIFQKNVITIRSFVLAMLGLIYLSLSIGLMLDISAITTNADSGAVLYANYNKYYPALIIFSLWINDTMAYIVGSLIGKTPLSKISPKKTWEGTIGGIILTVGLAFLIPVIFDNIGVDSELSLIIAAAAAITGTAGDLFESKLKRMAGVKDSGQIMPGHGGFLDRFDSLLFAIPICWVLLQPCMFGPC